MKFVYLFTIHMHVGVFLYDILLIIVVAVVVRIFFFDLWHKISICCHPNRYPEYM